MGEADPAASVDQVLGRPVQVAPRVPGLVVVVLRDGIAQAAAGDRVAHVARVLLELELRRVDAHDDQAALAVAVVPRPQIGQRPQAVDARVGPEVDQHDLSAQVAQGQRLRVEPARDSGELRGRAAVRQPGPGGGEARLAAHLREPSLDGVRALQRAGRVDDQPGQLVGDLRLEANVGFHVHRHRGRHHHGAHGGLQPRTAHAPQQPAAAEGDHQQRRGGAGRVADREGDRRTRRGAHRDHRGEDRARAGRVDKAERGADPEAGHEPVPGRSWAEASQTRQGALDPRRRRRDDQQEAEGEQEQHGERAKRVLAETDTGQQLRQPRHGESEAQRQPEDDTERTPATAARARRQDRRQDRQHARRHRRAGSGDRREDHQQRHCSKVRSWASKSMRRRFSA